MPRKVRDGGVVLSAGQLHVERVKKVSDSLERHQCLDAIASCYGRREVVKEVLGLLGDGIRHERHSLRRHPSAVVERVVDLLKAPLRYRRAVLIDHTQEVISESGQWSPPWVPGTRKATGVLHAS